MSDPTIWDIAMGGNPPEKFVPYADYARLKAEVERLRASSFVTAVPVEQYERLIKAGNAMVLKVPDMMAGCVRAEEAVGLMNDWIAAKKGKQP